MLAGRPDRIVEEDGMPIPEEHKSSLRVFDSRRLQVRAYLILLEEETGIQPPYGVVVTGDGKAHRVPNTPELRHQVFSIAKAIHAVATAHASEGSDIPTTLVNIAIAIPLGMVAMGIGKMAMRELMRRDDDEPQTGCGR
jgi:hypothetical protein